MQNVGGGTLNWSVTGPPWLTFSPASGSLTAGASQSVTISVNASANTFAPNTYTGTVTVSSNGGGGSGTATLTVTQTTTVTAITSDTPDPSVYGQPYDVSVSVSPTAPATTSPTGSVSIGDGTNNCTIPSLSGSGTGTCTIAGGSPVGSATLTATYGGDVNYLTSSGTTAHTVNQGATTTTVSTITPEPSQFGQPYTVTATIAALSPASGTPTGSVMFGDGTSTCTGPVASGSASCVLAGGAPAGPVTVTASYSGDTNFQTSAGSLAHTVSKGDTTTTITADTPDPTVFGEAYTVSISVAPVAPAAGPVTGTVVISDGTNSCTTGALAGGTASCNLSATPVGTATLTATYPGDTNLNGSVSAGVSHVVTKGGTATTITSDAPDPSVFGQSYTVAVTVAPVAPAAGVPSGSISITDGTTTCTPALAGGAASCTFSTTPVGAATLTATYGGDGSFDGSNDTEDHTIDKGDTATAIATVVPEPSAFGQNYTVSVTVAAVSPAGGTPGGTVTILDGTNSCTTPSLAGGAASCVIAGGAPAGPVTLTANYSGDASFNASTTTAPHGIDQGATTTTITADTPDPSVFGEPYTVSVSVAATGGAAGVPTGSVTITDGANMCTTPALSGSGTASCIIPGGTPPGAVTLTASYGGDPNFAPSSDTEAHAIIQGATATSITSDLPDPSAFGQSYVVSVLVAPSGAAAGTPTGTVFITDGTNSCTTPSISGAGTASCAIAGGTAPGAATLTATYAGDTNFTPSSGTASHTVNQGSTATAITADTPDPSVFGEPYTVSISVTPSGSSTGTPTGSVTIADGTSTCTTGALSGAGTASCLMPGGAPAGPVTLTATYSGDANFLTSSGTTDHTINPGGTTTTITADTPDPSVFGNTYTVSIQVVPNGSAAGTPSGTVTISDGANNCTTPPLSAGGTGSCVITGTPVGNATLTATYPGDGNFSGSSDTESHTVDQITSSVTMAQSNNPSLVGQPVTFTATVDPAAASGTVTFLDGATTIGSAPVSSAQATLTISSLAAGPHTITAVYGGDVNHTAATSAPLTHTVTPNGNIVLAVATSEGDGTFTFTSGTPALSTAVTTSGGSGQTAAASLNPGTYMVTAALPDGFGLTSIACSDGDSSGNVSAKSATIILAPAETVTCTFSSVNSRKKTVEVITNFMNRRNDLLLSNGPDTNRQIDRLLEAGGDTGTSEQSGFANSGEGNTASLNTGATRLGDAGSIGSPLGGATASSYTAASARFASNAVNDFTAASFPGGSAAFDDEGPGSRPGLSPINVTGSNEGQTQVSFATSLSQFVRYYQDVEQRKISDQFNGAMGLGTDKLPSRKAAASPLDIWMEGHYLDFGDDRTNEESDGHFGVAYLGADYVVTPSLLVGALVQYDSLEQDSREGQYKIKGHGYMIGPYATVRVTDNVFLQGRAAWGTSFNEVSPFLTYTDDFETDRWLVSGTVTGHWESGPWRFRPSASLAYIEDSSEAYTDSLGVKIPGLDVSLGQVKAGPEISYRTEYSGGTRIEPHMSVEAIWNFESSDQVSNFGGTLEGPEEVRGRIEAGIKAQLSNGMSLDVSGTYDGIGSNSFEAVGGKVLTRIPLN